jgi:hypothetical protein
MLTAVGILLRAAFFAVPVPASAQLATATILGVVKDDTGGVMPGVTLTVQNVDTSLSRSAISAEDGAQCFARARRQLRNPSRVAGVQAAGPAWGHAHGVAGSGDQLRARGRRIEETISVTADAPLVNTTSGGLGASSTNGASRASAQRPHLRRSDAAASRASRSTRASGRRA